RSFKRLVERDDLALRANELVLLPVQVAHRLVEQAMNLTLFACDARERQPRSLPELVVVDLRDGRAEAVLQLRLRRLDELPLSLQRTGFGEVELERQDSDVAAAHRRIQAARPGSFRWSLRASAPSCRRGPFARPVASRSTRARRLPSRR